MHSFLGLITLGHLPFPAQGHTHLQHCFRLKSDRGSKAAKRLGDFLQTEWRLRLCQSWGARVHHPLFLYSPKSFPEGPFTTMPVLGRPSLEESYLSLANQSSIWGQAGWSKRGRGQCPCQGDKLCLLSGSWSQGPLLILDHGGVTASETRQGGSQHLTFLWFPFLLNFQEVLCLPNLFS